MNKLYHRRMLFCFATLSFAGSALPAAAQSLTPQVISAAGAYLTGSNGSLSFAIGETAVESYASTAGSLTQGFQPIVNASNPLPLDFVAFAAQLVNNQTRLDWVTTHEIDTNHFIVERSNDGTTFVPIIVVAAVNPPNPVSNNSYSATDSLPLPGHDFYRIKEVDQNGQVTYSPIVLVTLNGGLSLMVYPNPAVDQLYVRINSNGNASATIALYDLLGRLVGSQPIQLTTGENLSVFHLAGKPKGVYIVKILGLEGLPTYSILKK